MGTPGSGLCLPSTRRPAQARYKSRPAFTLLRVLHFPGIRFLQQALRCEVPACCHTAMSQGQVSFWVRDTSLLQPGRDLHGCTAPGGRRGQGVSARTLLCRSIAVISTEDFALCLCSFPDAASHQGDGAARAAASCPVLGKQSLG